MPHWAIYKLESGDLFEVVSQTPSIAALNERGLGVALFGEDAPDLDALQWCPRRLSFIARRTDESSLALARLEQRLMATEQELSRLAQPRETWTARMMKKLPFKKGAE